jgi:putative membrane protein
MLGLILGAMRRELLFAFLLCLVSAPLAETIAIALSPAVLLPMLGISVSVFTAFRNTQAYGRWWEARTLWGELVNQSRNLRDCLLSLQPQAKNMPENWQRLIEMQVLLVWTINQELRGSQHPQSTAGIADLLARLNLPSPPSSQELLKFQARSIAELAKMQQADGFGRLALIKTQSEICNALGGLERINNQPLPAYYDLFIRLIVWIFGWLLFLRLDALHSPEGTVVGFLCLVGFVVAERLGAYTEKPFVDGIFGLPLNRICATISTNLLGPSHPLANPPEDHRSLVWT